MTCMWRTLSSCANVRQVVQQCRYVQIVRINSDFYISLVFFIIFIADAFIVCIYLITDHQYDCSLHVLSHADCRDIGVICSQLLTARSALHRCCSSTCCFSLFFPCCFSPAAQSPDGEAPSTAEVDLFMSTQRIKVLNADTQV